MANWYYRNKNNEKVGPISTNALKALAAQGLITPETVIENSNGRSAKAGRVNGLTFPVLQEPPSTPEVASMDDIEPASISPPPVENEMITMQFGSVPIHSIEAPEQSEVYGLSTPEPKKEPPADSNPFTIATPPSIDSLPKTSIDEMNPFTASMPDGEKPFVDTPPVADNPFILTSPIVENPFVATPASANPSTAPGPVPAVKISTSPQKPVLHNGNKKAFVIMGIVAVTIVCGIIAVGGYQRWQREEDRRVNRQIMEQRHQSEMRRLDIQHESQRKLDAIRTNTRNEIRENRKRQEDIRKSIMGDYYTPSYP